MHSTESRFALGPSNILFLGVYGCAFQHENFTGWGSEGVNGSGVLLNPEAPKQSKSDGERERVLPS